LIEQMGKREKNIKMNHPLSKREAASNRGIGGGGGNRGGFKRPERQKMRDEICCTSALGKKIFKPERGTKKRKTRWGPKEQSSDDRKTRS